MSANRILVMALAAAAAAAAAGATGAVVQHRAAERARFAARQQAEIAERLRRQRDDLLDELNRRAALAPLASPAPVPAPAPVAAPPRRSARDGRCPGAGKRRSGAGVGDARRRDRSPAT